MTEETSPGLPEEPRKMMAIVPLRAGSRPRWAELRDAAQHALERRAAAEGYRLKGQVRYVKRVTMSPFGPIDPETLLVDKYVYEAEAVKE